MAGFATFEIKRQAVVAAPKAGKKALDLGNKAGKRYVVVTALVPLEEQIAAYNKAFLDVDYKQPQHDEMPEYTGFYVERAEVSPSEKDADPKWDEAKKSAVVIWNEKNQWAGTDPEIVDLKYIYGVREDRMGRRGEVSSASPLVFPLGRRIDGHWGAEVAHEPEILLAEHVPAREDVRQPIEEASDKAADHAPDIEKIEEDSKRNDSRLVAPSRLERMEGAPPKYCALAILRFFRGDGDDVSLPGGAGLAKSKLQRPHGPHLTDPAFAKKVDPPHGVVGAEQPRPRARGRPRVGPQRDRFAFRDGRAGSESDDHEVAQGFGGQRRTRTSPSPARSWCGGVCSIFTAYSKSRRRRRRQWVAICMGRRGTEA